MLLLGMILVFSVTLGGTYPSGYYSKDASSEERALRILRRIATQPTPGPLALKLSAHALMDITERWLSAGSPKKAWRWSPEMSHSESKRRQNLASYNLNSFGLRYGK
ncbi:metastasis-suppressor KiSS-1 [Trichomycterus rosablanca]|uniref:metastasis-suppressor KiSS-1 n=1 Tax=Trichomycterus rosablanca TaxID=2290929 RepID=UPI002F354086